MFVILLLLCLLHSALGQTLRHSPSSRHRRLQYSPHRRLQAGSVHSGSQAHLLVDVQDLQVDEHLIAAVYIEDIGNDKTGRIKIANFRFDNKDGGLLEVNKELQDRAGTDVNTIPFSVGGNDNALEFQVIKCTGEIRYSSDNPHSLDIQCEFDFKDSDNFADETRNHVKCTGVCATFKDYNIVVVPTEISGVTVDLSATILPFVGTCTAGTYHESDHLCVLNSCHRCSSGYYCFDAGVAHTPTIGNAGTLLNEQCDACKVGTFANETGSIACTECAKGTYEPGTASIACTDCAKGTYENGTASIACTDCAAGYYEPGTASTECKECAAGTYEPETGSFHSYACKSCFSGTYQDETRATACKPCGQDGYMTMIPYYSNYHNAWEDMFVNKGATLCQPCPAGTQTGPERLFGCSMVTCSDEPHKCRDPTTGTCGGEIGAVNCQGQCYNRHHHSFSKEECPTMYSSFKLHTSDNDGVCEKVDADAEETCVEWRGTLQNGFTLDQVQSLPSQDDEFCNSTKAIYKDNMVKSAACDTQFSVIVPMYIYPNTCQNRWNLTQAQIADCPLQEDYKAWNRLVETVRDTPQIQFHIVINPDSGAGSSASPNADWLYYLGSPDTTKTQHLYPLRTLPNVHLYGYVPTGFGNSSSIDKAETYSSDYKSHWNISNFFFDEVNGAFKGANDDKYTSTQRDYTTLLSDSDSICNFGSPRNKIGVEYGHEWLHMCKYSVLYENSVPDNMLATFQYYYAPTYAQQSMSPTSIAAIMHTYEAPGDEPFKDQLQALYANHFGMVYFTPTTNGYSQFYDDDLWEKFLHEIKTFLPVSAKVAQVPWVPQIMRTPVNSPTDSTLMIDTGNYGYNGKIPAAFSHPLPTIPTPAAAPALSSVSNLIVVNTPSGAPSVFDPSVSAT